MSDNTIPLLRLSRAYAEIDEGKCGLRWERLPFDAAWLKLASGQMLGNIKSATASLFNLGQSSVSLTFKIAKDHSVTSSRSDVVSGITVVPGGTKQVTFDVPDDATYLELWSSSGSSSVKVEISTKIVLALCGFSRLDTTAGSEWQMPGLYSLVVGTPIDNQINVELGNSLSWALPSDAFSWSGGSGYNSPVISFTNVPDGFTVDSNNVLSGSFAVSNENLGAHAVTITAAFNGLTARQTLTINAVYTNKAPVIIAQPDTINVGVGQQLNYTVPFSSMFHDDVIDTLTYSVSGLPSWLTYSNGVLSGMPSNDQIGTTTITYTAVDTGMLSANASVNLVVKNDAPIFTSAIPDQSAVTGTLFMYTIPANCVQDTDAISWSASSLPDWVQFNAALRRFSGTPDATDIGETSITVTATDTLDQAVSTTFLLTVNDGNE